MNRPLLRQELIHIKLQEIEESVSLIQDNLPDSPEEFAKMGLVRDGMYKQLEFAIENVFDICAIINTDLRLGIPADDEDMIAHLVDRSIISEVMRVKLKGMKGFRNILVHRYGKIDDRLVFTLLRERIGDFREFSESIRNVLKQMSG